MRKLLNKGETLFLMSKAGVILVIAVFSLMVSKYLWGENIMFKDLVQIYFEFLQREGYTLAYTDCEQVVYVKDDMCVLLQLDRVGCQIEVLFAIKDADLCITLQDVIDYFKLSGFRGFYMYPLFCDSEISKGLSNLAGGTYSIMQGTGLGVESITEIYQFVKERTAIMLSNYTLDRDMQDADVAWRNREYEKVRLLYEKHITQLSRTQTLRLNYIVKNC